MPILNSTCCHVVIILLYKQIMCAYIGLMVKKLNINNKLHVYKAALIISPRAPSAAAVLLLLMLDADGGADDDGGHLMMKPAAFDTISLTTCR